MNCRFTTIDARHSSVTCGLVITIDSFAPVALRNDMRWALHHCPGEGSGESL
jgi:hypothetical protein